MNFKKLDTIKTIGVAILALVLIFGSIIVDFKIKSEKVKSNEVSEYLPPTTKPAETEVALEPLVSVPEPLEDTIITEYVVGRSVADEGLEKLVEDAENIVEYFDIPLDEELQDHIFERCEIAGIDAAVVIAMIEQESNFDVYAVGDGGRALGLMQIHPRWHSDRMNELECWDLMDPYQNITVGVDILTDLSDASESLEWVLMAYNGGEAYANRKVAAGEISNYATEVLAGAERLW